MAIVSSYANASNIVKKICSALDIDIQGVVFALLDVKPAEIVFVANCGEDGTTRIEKDVTGEIQGACEDLCKLFGVDPSFVSQLSISFELNNVAEFKISSVDIYGNLTEDFESFEWERLFNGQPQNQ